MSELEMLVLRWLGSLERSGVAYEAAWYMTDYSPTIILGLFVLSLLLAGSEYARMRRSVVAGGSAGMIALVVVRMLDASGLADRPRPSPALPEVVLGLIQISSSSFPSALTAVSTAVATAMWYAPGKSSRWMFILVALWTGLSRLVLRELAIGYHGVGLLGWLSAHFVLWLLGKHSPIKGAWKWIDRHLPR